MTPDRRAEIRVMTRARWVRPDVVAELLAEVDRLGAVVEKVRGIARDIRKAAKRDDERRLELLGKEGFHPPDPIDAMEKTAIVIRMVALQDAAVALEAAIARPLDSPQAKR